MYTYHYIRIKLVACWKGQSRSHSPTFYFIFMVQFIPFSSPRSQSRDAVNYLTKDYPGSPKSTQARARIKRPSPYTQWRVRSGRFLSPWQEVQIIFILDTRHSGRSPRSLSANNRIHGYKARCKANLDFVLWPRYTNVLQGLRLYSTPPG